MYDALIPYLAAMAGGMAPATDLGAYLRSTVQGRPSPVSGRQVLTAVGSVAVAGAGLHVIGRALGAKSALGAAAVAVGVSAAIGWVVAGQIERAAAELLTPAVTPAVGGAGE